MDTDFSNYKLVDLGQGHFRLVPIGPHYGQDVRISFLPGGYTAIYGDFCPGYTRHDNKGVISVAGYDEPWFRGDLSPRYLAEKFQLETVFRADYAADYCRKRAEELKESSPESAAEYDELADDAENVDSIYDNDVAEWFERLNNYGSGYDDTSAFYGYDQDNLDLLVAIHRAMVRLREAI